MKQFYSLSEAGEYHGISWQTARRAFIRSGMKAEKVGNCTMLTLKQVKSLTRWFDKNHPNAKGGKGGKLNR